MPNSFKTIIFAILIRRNSNMDTTIQMNTATIELPEADLSILKSLGKRLGWKIGKVKTIKKTDYERAIDDMKHGRITEYTSAKDMFNKLGI